MNVKAREISLLFLPMSRLFHMYKAHSLAQIQTSKRILELRCNKISGDAELQVGGPKSIGTIQGATIGLL